MGVGDGVKAALRTWGEMGWLAGRFEDVGRSWVAVTPGLRAGWRGGWVEDMGW